MSPSLARSTHLRRWCAALVCSATLAAPGLPFAQAQPANAQAANAAGRIGTPGDHTGTLVHAGVKRLYRVHVPASYSPSQPMPLVLALHGGGGNMDIQAEDKFYGQIAMAEQAGYIVVFPNGASRFPRGRLATWNAGGCCSYARDSNSDDVGFLRALVAHLRTQLAIDPKRVFANGMSNGGMMAYRLACEAPDVFRAVAAVAGTDNTRSCTPASPVSVLHIHARDDDHVMFGGGPGPKAREAVPYVSVNDTVAKWVRLNGCSPAPRRVLDAQGAMCEAYTACRGDTQVQLCVTETGGHSWPGGVKPRSEVAGSTAISAAQTIWDFFSAR
jgi:polyhydroxybutyrate depolymerase